MKNSQPSNSTSDPIAVKLLEADSDLESQEALLRTQLETIQDKRKSLQVVINLFESTGVVADIPQSSIEVSSMLKENHAAPETAEEPVAPTTRRQAASTGKTSRAGKPVGKGKAPGKAKSSAPSKLSAAKSKTSGLSQTTSSAATQAPDDWQSYVRKEFRSISLPQAVLAVLERQPDEMLEVAKIIESVFVDNIPKKARANIRARLSNVLSVGLKTKKWFRGKTGQYGASKEVADASLKG